MTSAPRKNGGLDTPMNASTVNERSVKRPALIAVSTPNTIPSASQMIPAPIASESVAGSPWRIESSTFTPCE